jgi:hypothetical protein
LKDRLAKETGSPVVWVTAILAMLFAWIDVKGEPKNVALSIWRCAVCIDKRAGDQPARTLRFRRDVL